MTAPIFKMPKIEHNNTRERKDFILDCVFISVGCSVLQVSVYERFTEGVKQLHKNKDRKQLAKIKEVFEELSKQNRLLLSMLSEKDLRTIDAKVKETAIPFIRTISLTPEDLNLEYVAISILKQGIARKRKSNINARVKPFNSFMTLNKIIKSVKNAKGYDYQKEWEVASKFVANVKY